jgi:hypothetical protein
MDKETLKKIRTAQYENGEYLWQLFSDSNYNEQNPKIMGLKYISKKSKEKFFKIKIIKLFGIIKKTINLDIWK